MGCFCIAWAFEVSICGRALDALLLVFGVGDRMN